MIKKIIDKLLSLSMLEQLSLNGGNFLFFIISAKIIGPLEFGKFSILWVGAQIIISISAPWIILPITSKSLSFGNKSIIKSALKKILFLSLLTPFLLLIYSYFFKEDIGLIEILMMYILGLFIVLYDAMRFFLVRQRAVLQSLASNITKWGIAFVLLFTLRYYIEELHEVIFISLLIATAFSLITQVIYTQKHYKKLEDTKQEVKNEMDFSLFHLGISNLTNSILITLLFSKVDLITFGALQAFRSLINVFPFVLQFVESHYSAILVNEKRTSFITWKWIVLYFVVCGALIALFYFKGQFLINLTYGAAYTQHLPIFIFLFMLVSIQSLSRLLNIQNRLQDKHTVFHFSAGALWISTIIFAVLINNTAKVSSETILSIMVITAVVQFILYLNSIRYKAKLEPVYDLTVSDPTIANK